MRRFISAIMILCLLHVTTYGAVAELAEAMPSHTTVLIQAAANPESPKTLHESIQHSISHLKQTAQSYAYAFVTHPAGMTVTALAGIACSFYALLCFAILVSSYFKGVPFSVVHTNLFGGAITAFAIPDQCINPNFMKNQATAELQLYQHLTQGVLPLTSVIPEWLNNAGNLMTMLGTLALNMRHHEHVHTADYQSLQTNASNLLKAFGMYSAPHNMSCDIILGDPYQPDKITGCQQEPASADLFAPPTTPGSHAKLLIIKWPHYGFDSESIRLVTQHAPGTQRYPNPDFSWDYGNIVPEIRTAARRMLLQLNNPLPLAEALKAWLTNAAHWQTLAAETANLLRAHHCPSTVQTTELNDLTRAIFDAHQALLTNGTVRCDMDIKTAGVDVIGCTPATEPKDYDHTANCPNVTVNMPRDAAMWFQPYTGGNYNTFLLAANPAPAPHAPTATQEAHTHTHTRKIPNTHTDTRKPSESLSRTPPKSKSLTLPKPETLEPTTPEPTTPPTPVPTLPVRNITAAINALLSIKELNGIQGAIDNMRNTVYLENVTKLQSLVIDVSDPNFKDFGAFAVAQAIGNLTQLSSLKLSFAGCNINTPGLEAMLQSLLLCPFLTDLNLYLIMNNIDDIGGQEIINFIGNKSSIRVLSCYLGKNQISQPMQDEFKKICVRFLACYF